MFAHVRIWMTKMKPESDGDEFEWPLPKMSALRLNRNDLNVKLVALLANLNDPKRNWMTIFRCQRKFDEIESCKWEIARQNYEIGRENL